MRVFIPIFILAIAILALTSFSPQGKGTSVPKLNTFFACKQHGKIVMSTEQFIQFVNQPICAKDTLDSVYRVTRFEIVYAETGLYQDSAGLPIIHTDYQFGAFVGDTIDHIWKKIFTDHVYKGDTIRFVNVRAKRPNGLPYRAEDLELILR